MSDNAEMSMIYASPICSIQTPEGPKCGIIKEPLIPRHIPIEGTKTTAYNKQPRQVAQQPKQIAQQPKGILEKMFSVVVESMVAIDNNTNEPCCSRCFRVGHQISQCYAGTDAYGNKLAKK